MNVALWIAAGLLGAVLLFAGMAKLLTPQAKLAAAPGGGWVGDVSGGFVKTLGALEVLGAAGLVLPQAFGIGRVLVPVAAVCVVLLMIGAMVTHYRRHELVAVVANVGYLALAAFVACGR